MADELAVVIKTKLEIDEQQLNADIGQLEKNGVKIPVEADSKSFNNSIGELQKNPPQINVQVNADQIVETLRKKLQTAKFNINVNANAIAQEVTRATEAATKKAAKKSKAVGVSWDQVEGSNKYTKAVEEAVRNHSNALANNGATLSSVKTSYDTVKKMYTAVAQYTDGLGETTSMLFKIKEGWEDVQIAQTNVTTNYKKQADAIAKTAKQVSDYETKLADLKSKAFSQGDPIPDDHAGDLIGTFEKIDSQIKGIGDSLSSETEIALDKLFADAERQMREIRSSIQSATDLRSKNVFAQKVTEGNELDSFVANMKTAGTYTEEMQQRVSYLREELAGVDSSDGLKTYLDDLDEAKSRATAISAELRETKNMYKDMFDDLDVKDRREKAVQKEAQQQSILSDKVAAETKRMYAMLDDLEKRGFGGTDAFQKLDDIANKPAVGAFSIDDNGQLAEWRAELKKAQTEFENFRKTAEGQAIDLAFDIDENQIRAINSMLFNDDIKSGTTEGVTKLRKELNELLADYNAYADILRGGKTSDGKMFDETDVKIYGEMIENLDQRLASASKSAKLFNDSLSSENSIAKANAQIEKLKNDLSTLEVNWSKALEIPELKADINSLHAALDNADAISLSNVQREFTELRSKIKAAGADCKSFGSQLVDAFNQIKSYFSVAEIFQYVRQGVGEMTQAVKEVDSAMTELRKVTNLSESGYDQFTREAASRAKNIGTSVSDYINSTADFSRLGFGFEDADTMAFAANIYYKVGDQIGSIEEATQSLVSTTQAYGLTASDALTIVDKLNSAGNSLSISSGGLGTALQKSASALAAGNNTLDESIALIAAANRVAQNPDAVGNMWKTVSMRIRSAKAELEEAGEDTEGMVESTAELQALIKGLTGFDILEADQKTFKSTYDIIVGIAEKWSSLEDIQQASLLEALAGKRQGNYLAATITNMEDLTKSMKVTQDSAGSAMTEHERWSQSIAASEAKAAAAFQEFSVTVMNSDLIKGVYDAGAGLLGFLTNVIEKLGAIPALAATVAGALSFKNIGISKMNMPYPTCHGVVA